MNKMLFIKQMSEFSIHCFIYSNSKLAENVNKIREENCQALCKRSENINLISHNSSRELKLSVAAIMAILITAIAGAGVGYIVPVCKKIT